jgi:DUF4097 and DUF4098 domain-containing protein YvlB
MEDDMNTNWQRNILMLALLCALTGLASASQEVSQRYPVARGAEVSIESLAGTLTIEGWSSAEVEITGTLGDGVDGLDVENDEDGISIEVEYDEHYHGHQAVETNLTIRVPSGAELSVETVSASISVSSLVGSVQLESVSGAIHVAGQPSRLEVENVSGKISVDTAPDGAELSSVSGSLRVGTALGRLEASNVSGSILVEGGELAGADFETVSGNITCNAVPGSRGDVEMETMSGTITLVVKADAAASYHLETFSGEIANQIGPEATKTSRYTSEKELRFNTGSGGPAITLSSFSGSIKLVTR